MFVISNAMLSQAEVVQSNRWDCGPLQLLFIPQRGRRDLEQVGLVYEWNRSLSGGFARPAEAHDYVERGLGLRNLTNPNLVLVPRQRNGYSELHGMLASLVPSAILAEFGIPKVKANLALILRRRLDPLPANYAERACAAFEKYIWTKLAPAARLRSDFFSPTSPLRLLAGDAQFWMHRLYRIALDRAEDAPEARESEDDKWDPLDQLEQQFKASIPADNPHAFHVRRPLVGGTICDVDDPDECDYFVEEMIHGAGVMDSLGPVIEALHAHRTHDDFSDRYSWVKEDFERSFYSKRSKLKVSVIETIDEMPVWSADDEQGYERVLFRDMMAFLDRNDRHLVLALRSGKTTTEIARELGHSGHAAVSRRIKKLRAKVKALLG